MAKVLGEAPPTSAGSAPPTQRRPMMRSTLGVEMLEERRLLSGSEPFLKINTVGFHGVAYILTVSGPGQVMTEKCGHQSVAIKLIGTTQDSQLIITPFGSGTHSKTTPLSVKSIAVRSGRLGSIQGLTSTDLEGPLSTLQGPVTSLQFDSLGPNARINIVSGNPAQPSTNGNLGQLTINRGIDLGAAGCIDIANDLTGSLSVSTNLTLSGGQINIGRDLAGAVSVGGNLTIADGGHLDVTRNIGAFSAAEHAHQRPAPRAAPRPRRQRWPRRADRRRPPVARLRRVDPVASMSAETSR